MHPTLEDNKASFNFAISAFQYVYAGEIAKNVICDVPPITTFQKPLTNDMPAFIDALHYIGHVGVKTVTISQKNGHVSFS